MWRENVKNAFNVWENIDVKKVLHRYKQVIDKKLPARYLIAKRIPTDSNLSTMSLSQLLAEHRKLHSEFERLLKKIDTRQIELSGIPVPEVSYLDVKIAIANRMLQNCNLCEHNCKVNRLEGETGICGVAVPPVVSSYFLHLGEEPPLIPSGTIFFSGCNLKCAYSTYPEFKDKYA